MNHLYEAIRYRTLVSCLLYRMLQDEKNRKKNHLCKQLYRVHNVVKFLSYWSKVKVLKHKRSLMGRKLFVNEDLTSFSKDLIVLPGEACQIFQYGLQMEKSW